MTNPINVSPVERLTKNVGAKDKFRFIDTPDVHLSRRKELLMKYPEISSLFGSDSFQAAFAAISVFIQFLMAYLISDASWYVILPLSYIVSGTLNHSLMLAIHELSHDNFFAAKFHNEIFALFANLPLGVAIAASFKRYHLLHHSNLGVHLIDMDLPTEFEASLMSHSRIGRLVWLILQPLVYSLRPILCKPLPTSLNEIINWVVTVIFDGLVVLLLGPKSLAYLLLGTLLGTGLHPMSGHFLEHLDTDEGLETHSYYGGWNYMTYNVGYHNEHHDFPRIPGSRLPKLKEMAQGTYDMLPSHESWSGLLWNFVSTGDYNLYYRFKRD